MKDFDLAQAESEGWAIFLVDKSEWQLQRSDAEEIFPDDESAWLFVRQKAAAGSTYHQQALEWLKAHAPAEYEDVMKP